LFGKIAPQHIFFPDVVKDDGYYFLHKKISAVYIKQ